MVRQGAPKLIFFGSGKISSWQLLRLIIPLLSLLCHIHVPKLFSNSIMPQWAPFSASFGHFTLSNRAWILPYHVFKYVFLWYIISVDFTHL